MSRAHLSTDPATVMHSHPSRPQRPLLSFIIALLNEQENLKSLFSRLNEVVAEIDAKIEFICVDDGSTDGTLAVLEDWQSKDPRIKIISLSRNFGKDIALSAGLDYADGDAVIPIDADLQDPPEILPQMLARWHEGFDVVEARRSSRKSDSYAKRWTANGFYRLFNSMAARPIPANVGDFRLLDRSVVLALRNCPERNRFMKGLFAWVGFRRCSIDYERAKRHSGSTKWNYRKLFNFAVDGIVAFSSLPLRIWSYVGFMVSFGSLAYGTLIILKTILLGIDVPGYASLMTVMLFLGGIQLISLGVIGEYIARVHEEVKRRPLYLIRRKIGFHAEAICSDKSWM